MKKFLSAFAFGVAYATFLSLVFECLLNLLGVSMGISLDSQGGIEQYPRFFLFCTIIGFFAFCILGIVFVLNLKVSQRQGCTKKFWCIQIILSLFVSIPMIKLWEGLFEFLQNKF